MARSPNALTAAVADRVKRRADDAEKHIDQEMDRDYQGGNFVIEMTVMPDAALAELQRRYSEWRIVSERKSSGDPRDPGDVLLLTFIPV